MMIQDLQSKKKKYFCFKNLRLLIKVRRLLLILPSSIWRKGACGVLPIHNLRYSIYLNPVPKTRRHSNIQVILSQKEHRQSNLRRANQWFSCVPKLLINVCIYLWKNTERQSSGRRSVQAGNNSPEIRNISFMKKGNKYFKS